MKRRGLLNKEPVKKKDPNIPIETEKNISISTFHIVFFLSNRNKTPIYVEAKVNIMYVKYKLHPPYGY